MGARDIAFPNLGIYLKNVPQTFYIGKFSIALYGIIFAVGILAGIFIAAKVTKEYGESEDHFWDFAIRVIIGGLIGARIYYVIFSWEFYKDNFWNVFNLRQGGIAIYGGVIGSFLTAFIFTYRKKINGFILADAAMPALILGQAIGRWGNFFNREVFGTYTDNIFAMRLPVEAVRAMDVTDALRSHMAAGDNFIQVHPTFLYESVCNLILFALLMIFRKKRAFNGEAILWYSAGYGVIRIIIEGIRTDQLKMIGTNIPVSQVVAGAMIVLAIAGEIVFRTLRKKDKLPKVMQVKKA